MVTALNVNVLSLQSPILWQKEGRLKREREKEERVARERRREWGEREKEGTAVESKEENNHHYLIMRVMEKHGML